MKYLFLEFPQRITVPITVQVSQQHELLRLLLVQFLAQAGQNLRQICRFIEIQGISILKH